MPRSWVTKAVYGGLAQGQQVDRAATVSVSQNINYRKTHDVITLNQRLEKDSGTVIDALPLWIKDLQGTVYSYLANGKIFQRIAAASWVLRKTVSASSGQGLGTDASYLYYASASFLGRFPAGGTWGVDNSDSWQALAGGASWKPILYFANTNLLCVGNGGNLSVYNYAAANFSATRLTMPTGWQLRDLEEWGDYLVQSIYQGSTIRNSSRGKMLLWDGLSTTFNTVIDCAAGNVQLTKTDNNSLDVLSGVGGEISRLENGAVVQQAKIPMINEEVGEYTEVFPGAKVEYRGIPMFGVGGAGNGSSFLRGVYSYGSAKSGVPESLNMEYTISEDLTTNAVSVGSLHVTRDDQLYVGWANSSTYGIDLISTANQYTSGFIETLQFHGSSGEEGLNKKILNARVLHKPLTNAAQSVILKIKSNYSASFATILTSNTVGDVLKSSTQLADATQFPSGYMLRQRIELACASGIAAPELLSTKVDYDAQLPS